MLVKQNVTPFAYFSGTLKAKEDSEGFFLQGGGKIPLTDEGFEDAIADPRSGEGCENGWRLALWESPTYDSFAELLSPGVTWALWKDVDEDIAYAEYVINEVFYDKIGSSEGVHFRGTILINKDVTGLGEELKFVGWVNTDETSGTQYLRVSPLASGQGRKGKAAKGTWGAKPERKRRRAS